MFRAIDRYILKECAWATLGVVAVLLVILLGNTLVRVLGDIANGKLPADALWIMLLINLVHYLVVLLPIGLYLGILLGMGRLYRDSEMAAMFACGIGTLRLYRPITALVIPLTVFTILLSMFLAPWTAGQRDAIQHQAKYTNNLSGLIAGQFNISNNGDQSLFFERWDENKELMQKVFYYGDDIEASTVESAARARVQPEDNATYIVFEEGKAFSGTPGTSNYRITEYSSHGMRLKKKQTPILKLRTSSTPTRELLNASEPKLIAEWHWRLAIPIACFLLAMLALPLSHSPPKKGRYNRIGMAILIYIIYLNSLGLGRAWLEKEIVSGALGLWWAHAAIFIAVCLLILNRENKSLFTRQVDSS